MRHESRESEVLAKHYHRLWKWLSIGSAVIAAANLFISFGAIAWHSWGESEHQKEIDKINDDREWELAEKMAGHANADAYVVSLRDVMDEADEDSNMFVDASKVGKKH